MIDMLRIINKTDSALSIENYELPERSSLEIDIPYTSNLKMLEKCNMIAVVEIAEVPIIGEVSEQQISETSADESEEVKVEDVAEEVEISSEETATGKRKRSRKTNN